MLRIFLVEVFYNLRIFFVRLTSNDRIVLIKIDPAFRDTLQSVPLQPATDGGATLVAIDDSHGNAKLLIEHHAVVISNGRYISK